MIRPVTTQEVGTPTKEIDLWDVALEGANLSLAEAHEGHEAAFDAWYESDHFYAGGLLVPGVLSGARWFASRALRDSRFVSGSPIFDDPYAGTHLATYFVTLGGVERFRQYIVPRLPELRARGRMFSERTLVHVGFHRFEGKVSGEEGIAPHVVLDRRFAALTVVIGTTTDSDVTEAVGDGRRDQGVILAFSLEDRPDVPHAAIPVGAVKIEEGARLLLAFSPKAPEETPDAVAAVVRSAAAAAGLAPRWGATFLPVTPGDPSYVARLR